MPNKREWREAERARLPYQENPETRVRLEKIPSPIPGWSFMDVVVEERVNHPMEINELEVRLVKSHFTEGYYIALYDRLGKNPSRQIAAFGITAMQPDYRPDYTIIQTPKARLSFQVIRKG